MQREHAWLEEDPMDKKKKSTNPEDEDGFEKGLDFGDTEDDDDMEDGEDELEF